MIFSRLELRIISRIYNQVRMIMSSCLAVYLKCQLDNSRDILMDYLISVMEMLIPAIAEGIRVTCTGSTLNLSRYIIRYSMKYSVLYYVPCS